MTVFRKITLAAVFLVTSATAYAQTEARSPELFDSRNAIIDTAIPFAIGAREAQQSLRGSFGWQTFQEGLVEGVYYRFDPDGYARFAPTPRLDQDQFEVICIPRSFICSGQKGALHLSLTQRGQLQIQLENLGAGDQFFLFDGTTELPLPARILEPLDIRTESLLMSGGELITKRNGQLVNNISLSGFSAVAAYIRWVAAGQDYSVLPRNWPIPNSATTAANQTLTQPDTWTRPNLASQSVVPWPNPSVPVGIRQVVQAPYDPTRPLTRILAQTDPLAAESPDELASLRMEIIRLKTVLNAAPPAGSAPVEMMARPADSGLAVPPDIKDILYRYLDHLANIEQSLARLEQLQAAWASMNTGETPLTLAPVQPQGTIVYQPLTEGAGPTLVPLTGTGQSAALSTGFAPTATTAKPAGLEADILAVIKRLAAKNANLTQMPIVTPPMGTLPVTVEMPDSRVVLERSIVEQILAELDATAAQTIAPELPLPLVPAAPEPETYQSLSDYFQSTVDPQN